MVISVRKAAESLGIVMTSLLLVQSAGAVDDDCFMHNSQAWCILDIAGYSKGAYDVPMFKAVAYMDKFDFKPGTSKAGGVSGHYAIAAMNAAKLTSPIPGISRGTSVGMSLLMALTDVPNAGEQLQFFGVLPESAVLEDSPRGTFESSLAEGVKKYVGALSAIRIAKEFSPSLSSAYTKVVYHLVGGDLCKEQGCELSFHNVRPPTAMTVSPAWAGDSKVYVYPTKPGWFGMFRLLDSNRKSVFKKEEVLDLIKILPTWFYVYVPGEVNILVNSDGVMPLAK